MNASSTPSGDSAIFMLPVRDWRKRHQRPARSVLLLVASVLATFAGLTGAVRRVGEFQRLDFQSVRTPDGFLVVAVEARSGAARAGVAWGDVVVAVEGVAAARIEDLDRELFSRRVSALSVAREGRTREVIYYPPAPRVDIRYLLVAFAAMFTLVIAGFVYFTRPSEHAGRFLALSVALFLAVVIPFPVSPDSSWQVLLLLRDFGRLALPPLLVLFFARFPIAIASDAWLIGAFAPSVLVALGRAALTVGWLPPVLGQLLLPEALDTATAMLAVLGVAAAAALGVRSYFSSRHDPTRRRQVEWVALSAAAGFTPYMLLTFIPQLAGAELEMLAWISLLPLSLVPLGVASSLLEFRLWDLEDITRQVVATGLVVLLGGVSFAFLNYAVTQFGFRLGNWRNLIAVVGGVLLATLMVPARKALLEGLERLQYRERLAARRALTTFAEEAVSHRDPDELLARLASLLREALAVDQVVTYQAQGDRLYPTAAAESWPVLTPAAVSGAFPSSGEAALKAAGLWHRFPLERDARVIGVVYCGRRRGELPLGHGERRLVGALVAQAALALENSMLLASLRRQVEEHRLLEAYLERIFQFSAAALLICDASGRILRANERAANLLACAPERLIGRFLRELVDLQPEWRAYLPSGLAGVQVQFTVEGMPRTGLLSTSTLEVEPGRFDGRVVALDDISDQLALEQRLSEQGRLAALGRLAAGLAHEVNTPVTGIASYSQLLRDLTPGGDPRAPLVEKLEEQAFRVSRIVTNLLELARPSGFERQLVNLAEVARDEMIQLRAEAERLGVSLRVYAPDEVTARSNRVQLELVIHNLVRNALQATPAGGEVEIEVGKSNGSVWLEVRDTGPGVQEGMNEQIFEPFVTTRQGRGGTGLGLAITRDIARAHGGDVSVRDNQPRGTVLRVDLPEKAEGV